MNTKKQRNMAPADALIYAAITRPPCNPPAQLQLFLHCTALLRNHIQLGLHGITLALQLLHLLLAGSKCVLDRAVYVTVYKPCRVGLFGWRGRGINLAIICSSSSRGSSSSGTDSILCFKGTKRLWLSIPACLGGPPKSGGRLAPPVTIDEASLRVYRRCPLRAHC